MPRPEDTRIQRNRLTAEAKAEQQARIGELSMSAQVQKIEDQDGVFDGQNGELVEPALSAADMEEIARRNQLITDADEIIEPEAARITQVYQTEEMVGPNGVPILDHEDDADAVIETVRKPAALPEAVKVGAGGRPEKRVVPVVRHDRMPIIRVSADVEPTIGQGPGNSWKFQAGKRYRVPEHVAQHLDEKGLVSQWG